MLRLRALLTDVVDGDYNIAPLRPPTDYPMGHPFAPSPSGQQFKQSVQKDQSEWKKDSCKLPRGQQLRTYCGLINTTSHCAMCSAYQPWRVNGATPERYSVFDSVNSNGKSKRIANFELANPLVVIDFRRCAAQFCEYNQDLKTIAKVDIELYPRSAKFGHYFVY